MARQEVEKAEKEQVDDEKDTLTDRDHQPGKDPLLSQAKANSGMGVDSTPTLKPQSRGGEDTQIDQ